MTDQKPTPPYQNVKIWMKTHYKLKLILARPDCDFYTLGELLDAAVEEYIQRHGIKVVVG